MNRIRFVFYVFLFASIGRPTLAQQPPWFNVPMVWGTSAGNYTCVTRPTGDARIAIITCDPGRFAQYPPFAQQFLVAHEHGHVYQIVYNPAILWGPTAEYDADCYAAVVLALNDVNTLTQTVHWFETVLGPQGGDATHGNGFQMAQRARQCAASVGVQITRSTIEPPFENSYFLAVRSVCGGSRLNNPGHFLAVASRENGQIASKSALTDIVSHGPDDIEDQGRGTPSVCTALEMAIDAGHSSFWEISTHTGAIRKDVSEALGGLCKTNADRSQLSCQVVNTDKALATEFRERVRQCLASNEWRKECLDAACSSEKFTHPNDADDHLSISVSSKHGSITVIIARPLDSPHAHDMKGEKPSPKEWTKPVFTEQHQ